MFSSTYMIPTLTLYQRQQPSPFDIQPSDPPIYGKHSQKTKSYNNTRRRRLNFCSISNTQPSSLSISPPNVDDCNMEILSRGAYQPLDSTALGHQLQSCLGIKEIGTVHAVIIRRMKDPVVFVDNNLISVYIKFGDLCTARQVFDSMFERNVVSWTAMINGYHKFGRCNEALVLFSDFVNCGFHGNAQTYVCMLNLCSKTCCYELGRQLHAFIIKRQVKNLILECAILDFYAKCSDLNSAFQVFDRMQKSDVISWTTMIAACSQHRRRPEAFALLSKMLFVEGLEPNEFTICSILSACGEESELSFGKQLHGTIVKKAFDMDVYIATSLVDMYAKCGKVEESRTIFDNMNRRNAITWTSIIAGYARNGLGEEALGLFRIMRRLKVSGSNLTIVSVLRACGLLRALLTGKEVHAQIFKNFEPTNIFIGSALVWLYCICGDYASASKVVLHLPDKDVVSWTAMISGCARIGHEYEALEYLKEMLGEGVEPNPFTYSSALKACARIEDIKHGRLIHSSITKTPDVSNVFVGSALVHMYSKCGHLSEAVQVFDSMPERNLVSWKAMIVAYARNGLCGEALKLMYRMKSEGIEVDDYILSIVLTSCGGFEWDNDCAHQSTAYTLKDP